MNVAVVVPAFPSVTVTSSMSIEMAGGLPQAFSAELLRGAGGAAEKSTAFESVSVQPAWARNAAVVLLSVGAAAPSKKFALP